MPVRLLGKLGFRRLRLAAKTGVVAGLATAMALVGPTASAAPAGICSAFTIRLLSAARHEVRDRIDRAMAVGGERIDGFNQRGRLLNLLPATGIPDDPALLLIGPVNAAGAELDSRFELTRSQVGIVPDLPIALSDSDRRLLRAAKSYGLEGPQCHLPELAFSDAKPSEPYLRVPHEYQDVKDPDCHPRGYLRMRGDKASYDLVETDNEVFVFADAQSTTSNRSVCAFRVYYAPSDQLIGRCRSDFCRHLQELLAGNAVPLLLRESTMSQDVALRVQLPRALSDSQFAVTFIDVWGARATSDPLKSLLVAAGDYPPLLLYEIAHAGGGRQFLGVFPRIVGDRLAGTVRLFEVGDGNTVKNLEELPIASMTVLAAVIEVTEQRRH